MTILLYEYQELEDRASTHLRSWKVCHTILFILAAIFGILNYVFLQSSMHLVDDNCILYPRYLEFEEVDLTVETKFKLNDTDKPPNAIGNAPILQTFEGFNNESKVLNAAQGENNKENGTKADEVSVIQNSTANEVKENETLKVVKREATIKISYYNETKAASNNATVITGNTTTHIVLDTIRSLYGNEGTCQFAEYMPLLSAVFGIIWATMFIVCPGGGRSLSNTFNQPWRILTPALLFTVVLVALTGHSFTTTNGGLQDFCASFHNLTNSTTCSAANEHLRRGLNATWGLGGRVGATRAAAAGVWVSWACAAALLLARCLAAPDFTVRHHKAYLVDPAHKFTPKLQKSPPRRSQRSTQSTPSRRDNGSMRSIPTLTTEVVTASVEQAPYVDSEPTSLSASPVKLDPGPGEVIELTDNPQLTDLR